MKVLLLTNEYPPNIYGGAGVHVDYLSRELARICEVDVRCFGDQKYSDGPLSVTGFGPEHKNWEAPKPLQRSFEAIQRCLDFNGTPVDADVVHAHTWYTHLGGIFAKLHYSIPLVLTVHSLEPLRPWKQEQLGDGYRFSCWVEKTAIEMADAVVAVSRGTQKDVVKLFNVDEKKVHIIHNGIDPEEYRLVRAPEKLEQFGVDPKKPFLLFVGRLTKQKGIIHLMNAIRHMDRGFQVVLCAGAPDTKEIETEMKASVEKAQRDREGVIWIPEMLDVPTKVAFYSHAELFCCPSIYEPFGIINLEAMACETPVVASAVGGIPEVVVDGETGLLVPLEQNETAPFEPIHPEKFSKDLAEKINLLMGNASLRKKMGKAGRNRAADIFSWRSVAQKTYALYASLLRAQAQPQKAQAAFFTGPASLEEETGSLRQGLTAGLIIENVRPSIEERKFPVKCIVGDDFRVEADIFKDEHEVLGAAVLYKKKEEVSWKEAPMVFLENDRWWGAFVPEENTRYLYTIEAWVDVVASWLGDTEKKCSRYPSILSDVLEGLEIFKRARSGVRGEERKKIDRFILALKLSNGISNKVGDLIREPQVRELFFRHPVKRLVTRLERPFELVADRKRAEYGAWYEIFPRSQGKKQNRSATFRDCIQRLPEIKHMGFDVLYLTPIHPIGTTKRKGPNNSLVTNENSPGSPWAIGSVAGGHKAVHPELGTLKDFRAFRQAVENHGIEIALDVAFQCSPDHPYVKEHPEWFSHRPDGTIHYAENPPKKYEDIYPLNFYCDQWQELWDELKSIVLFWIDQGVKIFRMDNPHTKPLVFWKWLIDEVQKDHPDAIFFAEAFTRPKVMKFLAKAGFTQSYTYFTWRNTKWELRQYLEELTQTGIKDYYRGNLFANTPDILHEFLQKGGRPAFMIRLILAATLSSSYGIYNGFELCEVAAKEPGSEEYLDSEKYQHKVWDWDRPGNIKDLISKINRIRSENPALQEYKNLEFYDSRNDSILCYGKRTADNSNQIVVVVNLNPFQIHEDLISLPLRKLGIKEGETYRAKDLLTGETYDWEGSSRYVRLDPQVMPAHIFLIKK
ncbi:MAG: glycogen synthase [Candidatus Omnitrophota bacterium]